CLARTMSPLLSLLLPPPPPRSTLFPYTTLFRSLVRRVIGQAGLALDAEPPELGRPLGEELLTPTTIYARDCLALAAECDVHAFAHVTGGGLAANLARVLPQEMGATVDRGTWHPPAIFGLLAGHGGIGQDEM